MAAEMSLTVKQTPHGPIYVGEIPDDFLRAPTGGSTSQQIANDEMTAQMLAGQGFGPTYNMGVPQNARGKISVSMAQAKLNKNYSITKMDPYCRLRIGHAVFETPTASSAGKNPRWNKSVHAYLPNGVDHVYVEIYDEKTFQVDERIAWAHVNIPAVVFQGETVDDWYPLSGKQGDEKEGMINLIFTFTVVQAPTVIAQQPMMMPQVVMMPGAPGMFYPGGYAQPPPGGLPQGQPQAQPQQLSEDELNQIKDMFPNTDMTVIKSVAEANRGNKDATINTLLSMTD